MQTPVNVLGVVFSVLALSTSATAARECARETPLPAEMHLIAPDAEVPEPVARFAGIWSGEAVAERGGLCTTLVVEEVLASGYARVIVSVGTSAALDEPLPWFLRATGRVIDGELRVPLSLPTPWVPPVRLIYRLAGETLQVTQEGDDWPTTLTRLADESQVGCGPPDASHRPAYMRGGLRQVILGPVHNGYFMPVGQAAPARHAFRRTVTVASSHMFRARHGCTALGATMPGFTVAFFTQGEHLVPVVRDILEPPGTLILSPGRVWSEPGDGGLSRASFPFVLLEGDASHNGLATFLYDDTQVSAVRFQIVQENVPWRKKYDGWGQASMAYTPGALPNEEALRAQFAAELQQHTPIRPWADLVASVGAPELEHFDPDTAPADLKASGLIVDGVIYLRGCETRSGPYPYCREMRHSVFSVTKSLAAAVTLLRLAQKYGDAVLDLKIKDYVPVTATHDGWERVTFADALNMATGIGDNWPQREPNHPFVDELTAPNYFRWGGARTVRDKLAAGFAFGKHSWGPGEVLRYNSINTFALAAAMDSLLKRRVGPQAHLWDMVVAEVFQPLGLFHAPALHIPDAEGGRGIPDGFSAFRFADGHTYDVDTMVLAGEAVRPFPCPAPLREAPPAGRGDGR